MQFADKVGSFVQALGQQAQSTKEQRNTQESPWSVVACPLPLLTAASLLGVVCPAPSHKAGTLFVWRTEDLTSMHNPHGH